MASRKARVRLLRLFKGHNENTLFDFLLLLFVHLTLAQDFVGHTNKVEDYGMDIVLKFRESDLPQEKINFHPARASMLSSCCDKDLWSTKTASHSI